MLVSIAMRKTFHIILLLILGYFTLLMVKLTIPYFSFEENVAFLRIKQWIIHNQFWKSAFFIHVVTSCFCLLAGFTQFSYKIRTQYKIIHRYMGWLYIIIVLFFSAPTGFIMGVYANGGLTSQIAFITLSMLWMISTFIAFYAILNKDYQRHQRFMIRSYVLTLSAITLRAWKVLIVFAIRPHPMDVYMVVAWLGWVPNLLLAEWYIYYKMKTKLS